MPRSGTLAQFLRWLRALRDALFRPGAAIFSQSPRAKATKTPLLAHCTATDADDDLPLGALVLVIRL